MFITDNDYQTIIGEAALRTVSQASKENRRNAELAAIEEISSYLRPKYDCDAIFSAEGEKRNRFIVLITVDIALYHLIASMPQKMGSEVRRERYERAVKWLEGVQAGRIVPDILTPETTDKTSNGIIFNSQPQLRHNW